MLSIFFIGLAVSMDAFSLSISIGTTNIKRQGKIILAISIGVMHFIMPLMGFLFGNQIFKIIPVNITIFNVLVFTYLGISMLLKRKEENKFKYSLINAVVLAFCVSIDSFSIGLGLNDITSNILISSMTFALLSGIISGVGLILGNKIFNLLKEKAIIIGAFILFVLAIVNLMKEVF